MKSKTLCLLILLMPLFGYSQWSLDVHANGGAGNIISIEPNVMTFVSNDYRPIFILGSNITYKIGETHLGLTSGVEAKYFDVKVDSDIHYTSKSIDTANYIVLKYVDKKQDFLCLQIPIMIDREFEKWWHFYGGIVNVFNIKTPDKMEPIINKKGLSNEQDKITYYTIYNFEPKLYTLAIEAGTEFIIKEHYKIGFTYYRDLTSTFSYDDSFYSYEKVITQQLTLKLGYKIF